MRDDKVLLAVFILTQAEAISAGPGIRSQLDLCLGNRNNTSGYRPEISDLNHRGFPRGEGGKGVIPARFRKSRH